MFSVHERIMLAVNRVEFVSDRMAYIILGDCCCHIIVLNVCRRTKDNIVNVKESFYE
jgi:hypothetical protein